MGFLRHFKFRLCKCTRYGKVDFSYSAEHRRIKQQKEILCSLFIIQIIIFFKTFFSMSSTEDLLLPCNGTNLNSIEEILFLRDKYFDIKARLNHVSCCTDRFYKTMSSWEKISNEYVTKRQQLYQCYYKNLNEELTSLKREKWLIISLFATIASYFLLILLFINKFKTIMSRYYLLSFNFFDRWGHFIFSLGIFMSLFTYFFPLMSYRLGRELIIEMHLRFYEISDRI